MNKYDIKSEFIQSQYDMGIITYEQASMMNDKIFDEYLVESFVESPLKKKLDKIEDIKNTKPSEYDGPEEVKKFVDKNFNDIKKCCEMLEKEPEKLSKDERNLAISTVVAILGFIGTAATGIVPLAIISYLWILVSSLVWAIIRNSRVTADTTAMKNLSKTKKALSKIDINKLDKDHAKKVKDLIQDIDDAETDIYAKIKKVTESVDESLIDYDAIYEAVADSNIDSVTAKKIFDLL